MKKIFTTLCLIFSIVGIAQSSAMNSLHEFKETSTTHTDEDYRGTIDYIDVKYGYKDLKFESSESDFLKKVKAQKKEIKNPGIIAYNILDQKYLKIGDCLLNNVEVTFVEGKLSYFRFIVLGNDKSKLLHSTMDGLFGKGLQMNEYIEQFYYHGKTADAVFTKSVTLDGSSFTMSSYRMREEEDNVLKKLGSKNAKDF